MNTLKNYKQLTHQYFSFKLLVSSTDLIVWSYYTILLFRETNSFSVIAFENLIFFISLWVGSIIASFYIDRLGYLRSYKVSFFMGLITLILLLVLNKNLGSLYILFAIFRGLAQGFYWSVEHAINLKEFQGLSRERAIYTAQSFIQILKIVVPIVVGAIIIYFGGYSAIFFIGIGVNLIALCIPFNYNKKPASRIHIEEITSILKSPYLKTYALYTGYFSGIASLYGVFFTIIPFILLGNEFNVGVLSSLIGICVALIALWERRISSKNKIRGGYIGYTIYILATIVLTVVWTVPILIMRTLLVSFSTVLGDSAFQDLNYKVREKILGSSKKESATEMNLITETIILISRIFALTIFILIISTIEDPTNTIRLIAGLLCSYPLISFVGYVRLNKKINH
jgi:YQGE family putative transporter